MAPPRYPTNPNTIKLTLDFDTLDRLKARAKERRVDTTRCAYELLQEALGVRVASAPPAAPAVPDDDFLPSLERSFEAIRNYKPKGTA